MNAVLLSAIVSPSVTAAPVIFPHLIKSQIWIESHSFQDECGEPARPCEHYLSFICSEKLVFPSKPSQCPAVIRTCSSSMFVLAKRARGLILCFYFCAFLLDACCLVWQPRCNSIRRAVYIAATDALLESLLEFDSLKPSMPRRFLTFICLCVFHGTRTGSERKRGGQRKI